MTLARLGCKASGITRLGSGDFTAICQADRSAAFQPTGGRAVRGCPVDVDAGHGAALGHALPTQAPATASDSKDASLTAKLRSFLSFPGNDDDPVVKLTKTHRGIHPSADAGVLRRSYAIAENM